MPPRAIRLAEAGNKSRPEFVNALCRGDTAPGPGCLCVSRVNKQRRPPSFDAGKNEPARQWFSIRPHCQLDRCPVVFLDKFQINLFPAFKFSKFHYTRMFERLILSNIQTLHFPLTPLNFSVLPSEQKDSSIFEGDTFAYQPMLTLCTREGFRCIMRSRIFYATLYNAAISNLVVTESCLSSAKG